VSRRLLPLLTLGAVLLAGCSTVATGYPRAASTTDAPTATTNVDNGSTVPKAPRVAHPLDASKLIGSPCDSLNAAELTSIDQDFSGQQTIGSSTDGLPACGWATADAGKAINVGFETDDTDGLSALYFQNSQSLMAYWQPTTVSGYPAIVGSQVDSRPTGDCVVNVGISDHLFFFDEFETASAAQQPQSCALATAVAADVIKNLQTGG
jgi:hypothetical protein